MNTRAIVWLLLFRAASASGQSESDGQLTYPRVFAEASEVRAHAFPEDFRGRIVLTTRGKDRVGRGVDEHSLEARSIASKTLSPEQRVALLDAVYYSTELHPAKDCYEPHHAFAFYDDKGKCVGAIEVCLTCSKISQFPGHYTGQYSVSSIGFVSIGQLLAELELPLTPYATYEDMMKSLVGGLRRGEYVRRMSGESADYELKLLKEKQAREISGVGGGADQKPTGDEPERE